MLDPVQFDELASYLHKRVRQEGFSNNRYQIGPLSITLFIQPSLTDLDFLIPFSSPSLPMLPIEDINDGLTLFIIQLTDSNIIHRLQPFLDESTKTLQQLSSHTDAEQFVSKDNERQILKVFDQKNRIGLFAFTHYDLLPPWELYSPIKDFLHLYALKKSCLLFHGASLIPPERPDQSVLLVGPGGSGKSTLTAYAIAQGMHTNGEDYVLVDLNQDKPQCWSVYRTLKLHPSSPALKEKTRWRTWKTDKFTGKSVMLVNTVLEGGSILPRSTLSRVWGVTLIQKSAADHSRPKSNFSDPSRHPYLHSCMSTIQQMPYRIDATLALSKRLHQLIPYSAHKIATGTEGLEKALILMRKY